MLQDPTDWIKTNYSPNSVCLCWILNYILNYYGEQYECDDSNITLSLAFRAELHVFSDDIVFHGLNESLVALQFSILMVGIDYLSAWNIKVAAT